MTISTRQIIKGTFIVAFIAMVIWCWATPTYDETFIGTQMNLKGFARIFSIITVGVMSSFAIIFAGSWLWEKNPTIRIGRKKDKIPTARTVENKNIPY